MLWELPKMLTKREDEFLTWLLDARLFGWRVPGLTKRDANKIEGAIRRLQRVSRPELLSTEIQVLAARLSQLEHDLKAERTVHKSVIQSRSHDGTENIEEAERLFIATLMARKRGKAPYDFLFDRFRNPPFDSATAIQMRVLRFEKRLQPRGPMSCNHIISMKYSQFLTLRRQSRLMTILNRYRKGKISYERYAEECKRLMWSNTRESRWLASLCAYAHSPTASAVP